MPLPLVVRELAKADIRGAYRWYDEQRPGLGDEFVLDLDETLTKIAAHPARFAIAVGDVRYVALSRFPYVAYYRIVPECLIVIAVVHAHRDPALWRSRI